MTAAVHQAYRFALDPTPASKARWPRRLAGPDSLTTGALNWSNNASTPARPGSRWRCRGHCRRCGANGTAPNIRVAPWWADNSKEAYSSGLDGLARALKNWADSRHGRRSGRRVGFPRFKQRGRRDACRFTTGTIRVLPDRKHIQLPRIGVIRTHESTRKLARHLERGTGRILAATITRVADRWYVAFTCELIRQLPASNGHTSTVGMDVGVRQLVVLSTGEQIANPRPLERAQRKRRRLQRQWHRQERQRIATGHRHPSRRQQQTRRRITRVDARAATIRRDGLHKLTSRLVREHGCVVVEQLNVQGMLRNRRLARVIADAGFGQFRRLLDHKCRWRGVRLMVAEPFYPSSKTCSACGAVRAKLHLGERVFRCQQCGLELDRDLKEARPFQ